MAGSDREKNGDDPLAAYRRIRKPMPPPGRVEPDKRREANEREGREQERSWRGVRRAFGLGEGSAYFTDRRDAGEQLAASLSFLAGADALILAIPRGGVEVGAAVADALDAPLDVVIPRKVGAPGNPELGLGAVAEGVEVLDERLIRSLGVSRDYLRAEIAAQQEEIRRRTITYRGDRPPVEVRGRVAVVVDDGVATGGTALAALRWARLRGASRVILAVPVAPAESIERLREDADDVVACLLPERFYAVGQWYADFPQVSDERVVALLSAHRTDA